MCTSFAGAIDAAVLDLVPPARNIIRIGTVKTGKRNHIPRIAIMSSVDQRNVMKKDALVIAIARKTAKNQRNIPIQRLNPNHRQMTVHSVRSKVIFHQRIVNGLSASKQHQVMQMVSKHPHTKKRIN